MENPLKDMYDKVHGGIVVIEEKNTVKRRLFYLQSGFFFCPLCRIFMDTHDFVLCS
jgi:hypothetical protein